MIQIYRNFYKDKPFSPSLSSPLYAHKYPEFIEYEPVKIYCWKNCEKPEPNNATDWKVF